MYISARARLILEYLFMSKEAITTSILADYMSVSVRTIRRDLKDVAEILHGYKLQLERGSDQVLSITGADSDKQAFKWQLLDLSYNEYTPLERQQFVLKTLLKEDEPIKLIALANDLSVTVSTISNDLTKIEEDLPKGVQIERRRGAGISLSGDELKKRSLLSDLIAEQFSQKTLFQLFNETSQSEKTSQFVDERLLHLVGKETILNVEKKARIWRSELPYKITDEAYLNLVIHIAISVHRMLTGHFIQEFAQKDTIRGYAEFQVAKEILSSCLEMEAEVVPDGEAAYVTIHLRGAKSDDYEAHDFSGNEHVLSVTLAKQLIRRVENRIHRKFEEGALLKGLTAHLRPALRRLNEKMRIHNPLVTSIKEDYPELFDIVKEEFSAVYLKEAVPEEEIGYLVLHFGAALLTLEEESNFSGIVVCASGIGTSRMLVTRLRQAIPKLKQLETVSLFELPNKVKSPHDVVVSTIDLGEVDFDYFLVSPMLSEREISQIELYLHGKSSTYHHYDDLEKEQQLTMLETIHRLENKKRYTETILDVLKNFQVMVMEEVTPSLEDMIRAILMRIMEKDQDFQVEALRKSLLSREKWGGFGISGTKMALFHARNEHISKPLFQIFPLKGKVNVPGMNGMDVEVETFIVLLAPEKLSPQGLEVLSYISSLLIESEETIRLFESRDTKRMTQFVIQKLNYFLDEGK
ncbi:PTS modulated transcriptional regulator MtlR family protein [Listeria fleischmannii 1991]|uniref:PTS modulated transcriptional regulator MtlR family protein n=2 Tax=Listeria fleischmannii TaxID=1069827 RepID=A0A0J8GAA1_9LIST|nr:BglG family transcription antiterminator [Listeria fleischmannii]KMT59555.1 PTS modulated transcriptional regulator MtlR family protein [Listeria fleischmannii 1991]SQC67473.1 Probable licABCH operon regulator [Listeria fleischmannii subsp. fleischmannii]